MNTAVWPERRSAWVFRAALLLFVIGCCSAILYGTRIWSTLQSVDVVVRMSVTNSGKGQLFPLGSNGYTEQTAVNFPLLDDGLPHEYSARLSGLAAPGAFRLDPGSGRGAVVLHSMRIDSRQGSARLEGRSLRQAVRPLKHLVAGDAEGPLSFHSVGNDPFLEVAIPRELSERHHQYRVRGLLLALTGAALLMLLIWLARSRLRALVEAGAHRSGTALFGITTVVALALLGALQSGCDGLCSMDGLRYGAALLLSALAMAIVGAAALRSMGIGDGTRGTRIFLWIGAGQLVLVLYVYLRSALQALVPVTPLSTIEMAVLVAAALAYLWVDQQRRLRRAAPRHLGWFAIEMALLITMCTVVADRELPRLVMLSSDPDTHAYLARQLELRGAIPWSGEAVLGYPGGTAALGFIWAKLSLLDVRNSVTALPLLQGFIAALMLGEALALRTRSSAVRLTVMLTTLGVTAAGFLIPLYVNYSHMEGAGRQIAIATAVIVPALLLAGDPARRGQDGRIGVVILASLFMLAVLNPISVVVPIILGIGLILHRTFTGHPIGWWLIGVAALPALLLLDPYYFQLIADPGSTNPKVTINETLQVKTAHEVLVAWLDHHLAHPVRFLLDSRTMGPGQSAPMFAIFVVAIVALRLLLKPAIRINRAALAAAALSVLALIAAEGLFAALRDDRRFYLLAPYYAFTLGQLKILLITAMAGGVILLGRARGLGIPILATAGLLLILLVRFGMHGTQRYALEPRVASCGSLGCATPDDIRVMTRFARMTRKVGDASSSPARVLVPNSVHHTRNEAWVFPVAGARALPFYDVPPVAFFYYQGDDDYTTEAYETHVCHQFDREWLRAQGVAYVFLPSIRAAACLDGMEQLPETEEILVRSGNSYLLRLRDR